MTWDEMSYNNYDQDWFDTEPEVWEDKKNTEMTWDELAKLVGEW